jgi:putative peptide zinc metalloprotease protein
MRYVVQDGHDQKIYLTGPDTAAALREVQHHMHSPGSAAPDKDTLALAFQFTEQVRRLGRAELSQIKPINPLFLRWEAIDLGRYDQPLRRLALRAIPASIALIALTFLICIILGAGSSWTIFDQSRANISFSGLALFAAISPLLKIPHELGHVLVARYFNIRLRNGGLIFIGLLPLPFVDCSMADIDGNRTQRVWISLAGVITDLWLAMIAFIGWHLVAGELPRTVLMNIFLFSSLNSLLFNGNPLIRLDGYYAFSDMIGHRNLSSKAAQTYKAFRAWVSSFGRLGSRPSGRTGWTYLTYGALSGVYKIYILLLVIWLVLPKLLGLGGLIVAWGALVMFATPLMKEKTAMAPSAKARGPRALFWILFTAVLIALSFAPVPLVTTAPLALDTEDTYTLRVTEAGTLIAHHDSGPVQTGTPLIQLDNLELAQNLELIGLQIATQELAYNSAAGTDPTLAAATAERLETLRSDAASLRARQSDLAVTAPASGHFYAGANLDTGIYLAEGQRLGYFLPNAQTSKLILQMDERFIANFKDAPPEVTLWQRGAKSDAPNVLDVALKLFQTTNPETGKRDFQVIVTLDTNPNTALNQDIWAKMNFGSIPLWQHAHRWIQRMQQTYLEVRFGQLR